MLSRCARWLGIVGTVLGCTQLDTYAYIGEGGDTSPGASFVTNAVAPVAPNPAIPEGAVWASESLHPIRWEIPKDLGPVDDVVTLSVSFDGAQYTPIDEVATEDVYFRWRIPSTGNRVRFRVTFHRTTSEGVTVLRHLDSPSIGIAPSQKRFYAWTKVADGAPFGPRDGAGGIVFGGKMWLLGGWNPGDVARFPLQCANDVWSSSDGARWNLEKPNTFNNVDTFDAKADWEGRHFAGYHVMGGKMWIVGGDVIQGRYQTDVWSSSDGKKWLRTDRHDVKRRMILDTNPNSPTYGQMIEFTGFKPVEVSDFGMRTLHVSGVFANKLWVMGGQRIEQFVDPAWPGAPAALLNDLWASSDGVTFTEVKPSGPHWSPRGNIGEAVEHLGKLWVIGGGAYDDPGAGRPKRSFSNEVWTTTDGSAWSKVAEEPPFSPRVWHNVKVFDGRLWVINGYDGEDLGQGRVGDNLADAWYSEDGRNWYDGSPPPEFVGRHAGTAWVLGESLFVGSGNAFGADPNDPNRAIWVADVWKMSRAAPATRTDGTRDVSMEGAP